MDDGNRPYRIRRPSSSLISSTTSSFPAPQPRPSSQGPARSSTSRTNPHRDIDDDVQPSSSTPSFSPLRRQNHHSQFGNPSSSSSSVRSSSPLGSPDSTFWGAAPSPLSSSFRGGGSVGPPTPGGNCVVSSSTIDDIPPSPFSVEENVSGNLMLPPLPSTSNSNPGASAAVTTSNTVSVISGSGNYNSNNNNNGSGDLPGSSTTWGSSAASNYGRAAIASSSTSTGSLVGSSISSLGGNSFASGNSTFTPSPSGSSSTSGSSGQKQLNESNNSNAVSVFNSSRSKIKKAASFERFSAQAQASSNNNNNLGNKNSANSSNSSSTTTSTSTSINPIFSNSSSISNVPASTSGLASTAGSSRLLWDCVPTTASTPAAGTSVGSSRLNSTVTGGGSLSSSLSESFSNAKPFHLKKLAAKIASIEQEQQVESSALPSSHIQSQQVQQSISNNNNVEESISRNNQDTLVGLIHPRESSPSPLNLTEGIGTSSSNSNSNHPKARNSVPTKSFLTRNIPLTPKQKLLQRLQSGELFNSPSPPPVPLPPPQASTTLQLAPPTTLQATTAQIPQQSQSTIQQQHQILLSSLQQPPSSSLLSDSLHVPNHQDATLERDDSPPPPPPLSPNSSPTPRASAELERYVSSMSISNYEAFIRASSGEDFVIQDSLGKNVDPGDLSNIQVLYDANDPYTYYYGNILVDEMDFSGANSSVMAGTSSGSGSSATAARQLLVMPQGTGILDDPTFQSQQQAHQGHGHLEFVLSVNPTEEQRHHELRDDDLQLGDISQHQSFLDPNDNGMSLSLGKSQNESTLRNLLMMEPLRGHDDSWISTSNTSEYQNRLLGLGGLGMRGMNLNATTGSGGVNSASLSLTNAWINDWPTRTSSWQHPHHDMTDSEEQNEVMDMSVLDMTDKGHGKRQNHGHNQTQPSNNVNIDEIDLVGENSAAGLSLLAPMDLHSEGSEPMDLQNPPQSHQHQHSHHRILMEDYEDDEPVNLMSVVNLEHELAQAQQHQSQQDLSHSQIQIANMTYANGGMFIGSGPPKVLSPPTTTFTQGFDSLAQQPENLEDRKIILLKKSKEMESLSSKQHGMLMATAVSPTTTTPSSTPGLSAANVILDKPVEPRAFASLPTLLCLSHVIEGGGEWTVVINRNKIIAPNTRFGPVEGPQRKVYQEDLDTADAVYPCLIMVDSNNTFWQLDRKDDDRCNWMKFVRLAHSAAAQNVLISEINGVIYFTTCKHIPPKTELQAGYDFEYAQRYGLQYFEPTSSDLELTDSELVENFVEAPSESYPCFECEVEFANADELNEHLESHREVQPEIQPKKKAAVRKYLNSKSSTAVTAKKAKATSSAAHTKQKTTGPPNNNLTNTILCKHCGTVHLSVEELKKHLKDSAPCGRSGNIEVLVMKAKQASQVAKESDEISLKVTKSKCAICYKCFATRDRLERHMLVHNAEELKPLQCNYCVKRFLTNSALAGHIKTHAEEGKCFECPMCEFSTQQLLQLKEHVQTHKNRDNGMFHCPHCTKKFTLYSMVRKHIRAFHGPRQFACDNCPAAFPSSDKLKLHKLKHSDHREFLCAECGRQFKRKDKLREHSKRMHENKKRILPITPEVLLHVPTKKEKLMKKFNPNPKVTQEEFSRFIYKCMDCMLGFKRRGMLVNHLAKRHPDKPPQQVPELNLPILRPTSNYFCPYCDRVYKSSSKRKSHILKSHPGRQIPPQLRGKESVLPAKQKNVKQENLPMISVKLGSTTQESGMELFSIQPHPSGGSSATMVAPDDNGVSGNVVSRREPVVASPHGCQWCHRQYATRAKLLQHQRKSHLHLMPPEIQTPRAQKNNVVRASDNTGIITVSVTDVAPLHSQTLELINASSHVYSTLDPAMLGNHSEKLTLGGNVDSNVIGYLLTTTTVTNGNFGSALEPEIVMVSSAPQPQVHSQNHPIPITTNDSLTTTVPISANVNHNHVISSKGLNLNLNPILTKTDD